MRIYGPRLVKWEYKRRHEIWRAFDINVYSHTYEDEPIKKVELKIINGRMNGDLYVMSVAEARETAAALMTVADEIEGKTCPLT